MIISLIVAMDENHGIGKDNRLPWRLSEDLKRFKSLTMGHHLVMGRRTYDSIGRPLPGRVLIVLTRNPGYRLEGGLVAHSLEEAFRLAERRGETEVFVVGGGEIFRQAIAQADRIYLSQVHTSGAADVFFPPLDWADWEVLETSEHPADGRNQHPHTFMLLARKRAEEPGRPAPSSR